MSNQSSINILCLNSCFSKHTRCLCACKWLSHLACRLESCIIGFTEATVGGNFIENCRYIVSFFLISHCTFIQKQPPEVFCEHFANFRGKHVLRSHFSKVEVPNAWNFIKKWLEHRCFLVKLAIIFGTSIYKNICERLLLFICEKANFGRPLEDSLRFCQGDKDQWQLDNSRAKKV